MKVVAASDMGQGAAPVVTLENIALPQKQRSTQILEGDAKQAAATLVEKLKFEVRVL
jgi:electron transfer flavoprotein beta subunit